MRFTQGNDHTRGSREETKTLGFWIQAYLTAAVRGKAPGATITAVTTHEVGLPVAPFRRIIVGSQVVGLRKWSPGSPDGERGASASLQLDDTH
ncbi:MAG: hypothetical protein ACRDRS_26875, partial [Pseudonocardiaceae bacterium]